MTHHVMAGLVPAIYVSLIVSRRKEDVDARDKRGHDEESPSTNLPRGAVELLGAQLARNAVEYGVDHADLLALDEGMRHVDILGHDDTRRHIAAVVELVGAGAQHRPQNRLDALERP